MSRSRLLALCAVSTVTMALALTVATSRAEDEAAAPAAGGTPEANLAPPAPAAIEAPTPSSGLATSDVDLVRDAVAAYRKGDLAAGDTLRSRAGPGASAALLEWTAIRFGGATVGFERALAFMRAYPDWPGAANVRRRAEELLLAERKPAALVRAFFAKARPQSASGKLVLAEAFRADGLLEDARALVREAWRNDTFGRELEIKMVESFGDAIDTADRRFRMERFLFRENWEAARRAADFAGRDYGSLVKARAAVVGRQANAAKLIEVVPAALKTDPSFLFTRAQFLRRADKTAEAASALAEAPRDPALLVDADEWWIERRLMSRRLLDSGDPKAAYAVATGHTAVSGERRIEAEFQSGWIALRFLNDPAAATRHFGRAAAIAATPISIARAAYWQGRAVEAAGQGPAAMPHYERAAREAMTYYGQLALAKLGRPVPDPRSVPPPIVGGANRERSPVPRAVELLYAANLREIVTPLLIELGRNSADPAEIDAVADIVRDKGDARSLLALGKAAFQRGLPLDDHAFPTIGIPPFEPAGPEVERAMVYAIARQESAFDPAALSTAGARGLMQLMPATAQATAKKFGVEFDAARLGDPSYNARIGAAHLGELMGDWKGSHILTFASYNAGPGNVRKWIAAYGDPRSTAIDPIDWVERIPFSETRNYVQRVLENLHAYRKRLTPQRTASVAENGAVQSSAGP